MVRSLPSSFDLQYFIETAHTLNISRAAERLGISQPSLSLSIKRLEDALGTDLLIRGKGGVQLTRTGQKFVTHARHLLEEWDNISKLALRGENQITGRFSIGCHQSVALYALPGFLPDLMVNNEDLEIVLNHGLSRQITDDVINFKTDFGIVVNPVEHPDLVIRHLAKDEVTLYTAAAANHKKIAAGEAVLVCDPDLLQTQSLMKAIKKKGLSFQRNLTSSSLEVIVMLTAADVGVGILPGRVASRDKANKLVPLPGAPKFQDQISLIYRADSQKSAASKIIISAMQKCL
jgi:DNA-binding transcriptional LysR family regulator